MTVHLTAGRHPLIVKNLAWPDEDATEAFARALAQRPELVISHFDFYRFNDPSEWEEAGFRDMFASPGLKLVEWPDKAGKHLPQPDLVIAIEMLADATRSVTLTAHTPTGAELLA